MSSKQVAILFLLLTLFAGTYAALNYYNVNRARVAQMKLEKIDKMAQTSTKDLMLTSTNAETAQSGDVNLSNTEEGLLVEINVSGYLPENPQPAYIHKGGCPSTGEIAFPLNPVINGVSKTIVPGILMAQIQEMLPLSINVHMSADDLSLTTSCGEIKL